jgi:hypothetical protein
MSCDLALADFDAVSPVPSINPFRPNTYGVSSHSNDTTEIIPLTVKIFCAMMLYGLAVLRAGHSPLRAPDPPDCLHSSYSQPRKRHFLSPLFSISYALFCTKLFYNPFAINSFRTLCTKHPGWVHPPRSASCFQALTNSCSDLCTAVGVRLVHVGPGVPLPLSFSLSLLLGGRLIE